MNETYPNLNNLNSTEDGGFEPTKSLALRSRLKGGHVLITFFFGIEGSRHNLGTLAIDKDNYNYFMSKLRFGGVTRNIEDRDFKPLDLNP